MPDNEEAFKLVGGVGLEVFDSVSSIMQVLELLRNLAIVQMLC
jgi:hypothetical protein